MKVLHTFPRVGRHISGVRVGVAALMCGLVVLAVGLGWYKAQAQPARTEPDAWDRLLAEAGLTRDTCRFDLLDMAQFGGGAHRLPFFDALHQDPLRIPSYARTVRHSIAAARNNFGTLVAGAAGRTGHGTRLDLLGDPLKSEADRSAAPNALMTAVEQIWKVAGLSLAENERRQIAIQIRRVPKEVQRLAAFWLLVEARAAEWRKRAFRDVPVSVMADAFRLLNAPPNDSEPEAELVERLIAKVDLPSLLVGGELLAFAADRARVMAQDLRPGSAFVVEFETPLGAVRLAGDANDTHSNQAGYLLIVDTGGNDLYRAGGGTQSPKQPVSVLMDLRGDDRYVEAPGLDTVPIAEFAGRKATPRRPCFGGGVLGYGVHLDLAGNDLYRTFGNSQGCGIFGVGLLADHAGSDRYDCHTQGQGSATFGVGVLSDAEGSDEYHCFLASQGYGGTLGSGLLADFGPENDLYEASDAKLDFPSPQTAEHNANLCQGFGYGRRADYTDGHSRAGGVGILYDEGGDNTFRCGLFGQGAGYWYGVGMLLTGPGKDTYDGVWYVQGSAAHFAVGVLADEGGDDHYRASMNMAQGAGHDFSVGFLLDRGGNDRYEAPNLSLGGGNANGIGIFWDVAGVDTYTVRPSTTLGRATREADNPGSIRARNLTIGLFLDTGGDDQYPADIADARNNATWSMEPSSVGTFAVSRGAGLDVEAPSTRDPR